jgi:hypothetical protein
MAHIEMELFQSIIQWLALMVAMQELQVVLQ